MAQTLEDSHALSTLSNQFADAVERAARAVVRVDGRPRQPASGIVHALDLVVAADHAVERDDDLHVATADGRLLAAELAGRDGATDLAVLRVPGLGLEPAVPAAGPARVGQFVLAVGRPGGREVMASIGIVSAIGGPARTRGGMLEEYIRTDATPYPGFSGGPLVDARGALLGVLTTGLAGGIALAVPVALAWRVAETLARDGSVARGYLGVGSQPVRIPPAQRAGRRQELGLLIVDVAPDSPAGRAGLLVGDILVALDGRPVEDADGLQMLLGGDRVGRRLPVEILRGGVPATVDVTVGRRGERRR